MVVQGRARQVRSQPLYVSFAALKCLQGIVPLLGDAHLRRLDSADCGLGWLK